jgi:polysaccharide biosynthesis protein PslG
MVRLRGKLFAFFALVIVGTSMGALAQVPATFFGMQMGKGIPVGEPWPVDSFATTRLWDSGTAWALINTAPGRYDWTVFDAWLNDANAHGIDVVYCFGRVPQWASSNPNNRKCAAGGGPGQCSPPNDLNADGTGTNQHFKDFVTAVVTRAAGRVHYWETWDEAPNPMRWGGTLAQMLRIAQDLRTLALSIDPTAVILSPSGGIRYSTDTQWFQNYYKAGGGNYADIITYHGYVDKTGQHPNPEQMIVFLNQKNGFEQTLKTYGQNGKPQWDTEGSWGIATCCDFTDSNLQTGFVPRFILAHTYMQSQRFYWYQWDSNAGTLWRADPHNFTGKGTLVKAGIAYQQIYEWLVGNTISQSCSGPLPPKLGVWTCGITGANGFQGQIVWDTSQTCSPCTYSQYSFNPIYIQYVNVFGQVTSTSGMSTVPIGYQPIFLENQNE